jgi:hypothetical protein
MLEEAGLDEQNSTARLAGLLRLNLFGQLLVTGVHVSFRFPFAFFEVNEFYQKECQEKTSASTGGEMFSRRPAHWN